MLTTLAFCVLLATAPAVAQFVTPLRIKTCADDQPNVVECRRQALAEAVPLLARGIPQMGAAPIDRLEQLPPLSWQTSSRWLDIRFRLDNARFSGLGRSVVDSLQVDTVNNRIRVVSRIDGVSILEGTYNISGHVFGVPMDGSGIFKLTESGGSVDVTYVGHLETNGGGQSYLKLDGVSVALDLGESHYQLTGIYGGYQPLVEAGNKFINSVSSNVVPDMLPTLESWLAEVYQQRAQAVFSTVPYNQLFPKTSAYSGFYNGVFIDYF